MKVRIGFVSNSSSSSFVINKQYLSPEQIQIIKKHRDRKERDAWEIYEDNIYIRGQTSMDYFDMYYYLETNGIDMSHVTFSDHLYWDYEE
jgi:hypothetical protein